MGWHQGGNSVDQIQWSEGKLICPGAALGATRALATALIRTEEISLRAVGMDEKLAPTRWTAMMVASARRCHAPDGVG